MSSTQTRKRFFRRKRIMIPLVLLLIAAGVAGYFGWQVYSSFREINRQSTPPPEVSIDSESGSPEIAIDTGPAQAAVQTWEAERNTRGGGVTPTPTSIETVAPTEFETETDQATEPVATTESPTEAASTTEPTATSQLEIVATEIQPTGAVSNADQPTEQAQVPTDEPTTSPGEDTPTESEDDQPVTASATEAPTEEPQPTEDVPVAPTPPTGGNTDSGSQTFLLMGVDATDSEAIDVGVRPDVLAVLYLDSSDNSCRMLRIPRDARVDLPGYGLTKINHALAVGGIPYQTQVVEQFLNIEIDHYGLIDFAGVVTIVDEIGGVEVDNPAEFEIAGEYFPEGVQLLNGDQALLYARFRGDAEGDFGRISRQQEVLRAVLRKVSPQDMVSMLPSLLPLLKDHFRTDLDAVGLADLAADWGPDCTYDTLETQTMPGSVATFPDPMLNMNLSYVVIDPAEVDRLRQWLLEGE